MMKVRFSILMVILLCINVSVSAQRITLNLQRVKLEKVFTEITQQTGYVFNYSSPVVNANEIVSIKVKNLRISGVLNQLFSQTSITYEIKGKRIFLIKRKVQTLDENTNQSSPNNRKKRSGRILDEKGEPIIGATVKIVGEKGGAISDINGNFSVNTLSAAVLDISYVGYRHKLIKVNNQTRLVIVLSEDSKVLNEVVVVGYGTQKRTNLTGAVSTVDVEKTLEGRSIPDVGRGLQGAVPGLNIVVPDGEIGSNPKFKIRGAIGSLEGGSSPLILLDNVEIPSIQVVNPDDVESISVLKDAASASIYGSKGAFGVILITTKKGAKTDKVSFSYSGLFSWKNLSKDYSIAGVNGLQYMLDCRAREKDSSHTGTYSYDGLYTGAYFRVSQESLAKTKAWIDKYGSMGPDDPTVYGRDWYYEGGRVYGIRPYNIYDYIIKDNAPTTQHNISVNGRVKNTTFNIGLGYLSESGMLKTSTDNFTKYNASVKVETEVNKWLTVRGGMMFSSRSKKYPFVTESGSDGPWIYLYRWSPLMPLGYNEDGEIIRSPQSETQQAHTQNMKYNYTNINLGFTLNLLKGWTVNADYTYSNEEYIHTLPGSTFSAASYRDTPVVRYDSNGNAIYVNENGEVVDASADGAMLSYKLPFESNYNGISKPNLYKRDHENAYRHTLNAYTDYLTTLKDIHTLKFMLGMNLSTYDSSSEWTQVTSLTNFDNPQFAFGTGTWTGGGDASWQAQLGFFGRFNYSLMDKYLFEANLRYNGTSKFPKDLRWKWFPSVSAGWRFGEEEFMKWAKPTLSSAKLRVSWGEIGDQTVCLFLI